MTEVNEHSLASPENVRESKSNPRFWKVVAIIISSLLWCSAVILPVWETRSNHSGHGDVIRGVLPAFIGWLGLIVKCPAWFANLLLIPLFVMLFKTKGGFLLSLVAFVLAATAYIQPAIYGDNDEAVIVGRLIGYYLWLGSFLIIALAHALLTPDRSKKLARLAVVAVMIATIPVLEKILPARVSPLERALRLPDDIDGITTALNARPAQAEKDTALWWAVTQDLAENPLEPTQKVRMLIATGAKPNQHIDSKNTLLIQALSPRGSESLIELLVQAGADVNARDYRGKTVLDIAREVGRSPKCQKFLENAGARASTEPKG